jgi:hypothetical protein
MSRVIELTTIYYPPSGEPIPERLKLSNCELPLRCPIRDRAFFSGLYGQGKLATISDALLAAQADRQNMVVIDVRIELPRDLLKARRPKLADFDQIGMLSTQHTTTEVIDDMADHIRDWMRKRGTDAGILNGIDWREPLGFLQQTDLIAKLLTEAEPWNLLPAVVYQAYVSISMTGTMVATVRRCAVKFLSAQARFSNTEIEVDI